MRIPDEHGACGCAPEEQERARQVKEAHTTLQWRQKQHEKGLMPVAISAPLVWRFLRAPVFTRVFVSMLASAQLTKSAAELADARARRSNAWSTCADIAEREAVSNAGA